VDLHRQSTLIITIVENLSSMTYEEHDTDCV